MSIKLGKSLEAARTAGGQAACELAVLMGYRNVNKGVGRIGELEPGNASFPLS
jgi:hypothetical protein